MAADRRRRKRRTVLLGAAAAVLAVVLGAGGWLLWPGEETGGTSGPEAVRQAPDDIRETTEELPVSPEGELVLEHDEEDVGKATDTSPRYAPGTWATDKVFAKGVARRIEGYRIKEHATEKAWTLELDGHLCATSRHVTADGRTAVVVQPPRAEGAAEDKGVCDQVVFVDLNTGKKLWQKKMPSADFAYATNTNLTLTKGVVAVAWGRGSVAYGMEDGRHLWNGTTASQCEDKGFAGGRALVALVKCGEVPDATYRVQKLDPRTGKAQWTYRVSDGVQDVYLPSSDPPVLAVAAGDSVVTDLISLDGRGRHLTTVSLSGYEAKCGTRYFSSPLFGVVENCDGMVVGGAQAFVMSKENIANGQPSDWIVAFDLKTGETRGKFEGRWLQMVYPLRMSGDELLVYRRSGALSPASIVSWNPRTDKETPFLLFVLPEDEEGVLSDPEQSDILVENGKVFFARRTVVRDDEYPKDPVLLAVGYGSAGLKH
ncbi:PQQ-binding-like beta-propeller repeat protein [Streptomyces sp. DH24]|uniref:outer membrane protein assembly factor BamB family protein n=1 Tax=Streptomyces sp. DH24 TaxID=3040123 RepID=UPI00244178EF|nr:PQQ-binding-like beta-propeller repeat protein [Streptomyces sp. DH24]MDG9720073.1 PQQ-binding-like beta-propeller repeat protein [Streptomyces sp. DH24]